MTVRKIKSIGDIPYPIDVGTDALSPLLTAGAALGITGDGPTETAAWLQRTSTSDGPTTVKGIHGRTLRWNQLVQNGDFASATGWGGDDATVSVADNTLSMSPSTEGRSTFGVRTSNAIDSAQVVGHKYLAALDVKASVVCRINPVAYGVGALITIGTANVWQRVGHILTLNATVTGYTARVFISLASGTFDISTVVQLRNYVIYDLTAMFGAGSEPSTVAEFEALYPLPYYPYDAGSLLPVNMTGIETTGFNQWDESWEVGAYNASGNKTSSSTNIRSAGYITVFPSTTYYHKVGGVSQTTNVMVNFYDDDKAFISHTYSANATFETPDNCRYVTFYCGSSYGTTYNHDICINLSDPTRNGTYEPYWNQERTIPAGTLRGAGSVYDELTETERITRIGEVDLGTLTWIYESGDHSRLHASLTDAQIPASGAIKADIVCPAYDTDTTTVVYNHTSDKVIALHTTLHQLWVYDTAYTDAATFKAAMSGVMLHYALATPTVTPYASPLNLTYRTEQGGTERVIVPTGEQSAPPTIVTAQGYTAESLRDAALSTIAPVENGTASTNYAVGSYLVHGGQLCRVTTAIATGESISIGTNVVATTVMAEVLSLTQ